MDERLRRTVVPPTASVRAALQSLNRSAMRIVLIVEDERLLGVLTDGDIRRWILGGNGLDEPVTAAMNARPLTVGPGFEPAAVEALMVERGIEFVPVVDSTGAVVSSVHWTDLVVSGPPRPARADLGVPVVIMAGGEGTRLAPYTKVLPKPLVPVGDKPVTEHIMDRFAAFGCSKFLVSLNYRASLVRAYFADADLPYEISFYSEEEPLGTGGSLSLMRRELRGGPMFVTNCDILVDADYADVLEHHRTNGHEITIVASLKHVIVPYGVCDIAEGGRLTRITEKPAFDYLVSTGLYVLEPTVLDDVPDGEFFHLTDLINDYLATRRVVGVYPISEDAWSDIGQLEELKTTLARFGSE